MTAVPGDSGAWIYNSSTLQLCGHVLAWSPKRQTAYIAPMEVLFEDIKRTLDAEHVSLPEATTSQLEADVGNTDVKSKQPPLTEMQSAQLNQQLEVSREVELALREMTMSDEASVRRQTKSQSRSRLKKDVPDSVQAAFDLKKTSQSLSDQSHESGFVR